MINKICMFFILSFKIQCIFFTYSTYHLRLASFQVLDSHVWLVATILVTEAHHFDLKIIIGLGQKMAHPC